MAEQANTVRRSFSLDALDDHDIIEWLARQDNVSEIVRAALRKAMGQPSQSDVMDSLGSLTARVEELLHTIRSADFTAQVKAEAKKPGPNAALGNLQKMVQRWDEQSTES